MLLSDVLQEEEEEEEDKPLRPSPDADTFILFTKPTGTDFPAGALVKFLVGFTNKGSKDFIVDTMDASFRYPQDYSFYIQNVSSNTSFSFKAPYCPLFEDITNDLMHLDRKAFSKNGRKMCGVYDTSCVCSHLNCGLQEEWETNLI